MGPGQLALPRASSRVGWSAAAIACVLLVWLAATAAAASPRIEARAFFVQSGVDGTVLASRADSAPRAIASITKLMTVLVALDHLRLDEVVTVPAAAADVGESSIMLRTGERLTVRELVEGTLIPSANDAATALALAAAHGSLSRFVAWMNEKAVALGMRRTHFVTPHGLDTPGHVSTARDVVLLLRAALAQPVIRRVAGMARAKISGGRELVTTDDLLSQFPRFVAGKTGHTDDAGWSEVAAARRGPVTIYASVLGEPTRERRNDDLASLLAWGLAQYRRIRVVDASRLYALSRAPYGRPAVRLVAPRTIEHEQLVGRPLVEKVQAPIEVRLPVARGERLGEVRVYERGRLVASSPLVAQAAVARPSAFGRARWYATRTLHHVASLFS